MAIRKKKAPVKKKTKRTAKSVSRPKVKKSVRKKVVRKKTKVASRPVKKSVRKKAESSVKKTKVRPAAPRKKKPVRPAKTVSRRPAGKKVSPSSRARSAGLLSRHEVLKKLLIQRREEIVREAKSEIAKYIKGEANQLVETALDDGDWSVIDLSADINLRLLESHRESLLKIDESLRKLREGSYGMCEDCGSEISAERLKVVPFAILCRDCQEKKEELEKATREELHG